MQIVAGAPGSGKSWAFPVSEFGIDFFNADDRAASLNGNSYHSIPLAIRQQVNREFEQFISDHIHSASSFAIETTLRSAITFEQIAEANRHGFAVTMRYLGIENPEINLERIAIRADFGFHSAPRVVLLAIRERSLENLRIACRNAFRGEMELILYDNTTVGGAPAPVYRIGLGRRSALATTLPKWVELALQDVDFS